MKVITLNHYLRPKKIEYILNILYIYTFTENVAFNTTLTYTAAGVCSYMS